MCGCAVPFTSSIVANYKRHKIGAFLCRFAWGMKNYWTNIVQYMKEQCWKTFGSRPVVDDNCIKINDDLKENCWDKMLPELLTEILMRIEVWGTKWPFRRNVVHCAGVCRSWRKNMMEIAKCQLELSGNLTFPISLKQPGSVGSLTRCLIDRHSDEQIYYLYLNPREAPYHDGKFLLAAKRVSCATCTEYIISYNYDDFSKGSSYFVGMLRSNFFGTKFTVYDAIHPPKFNGSMLGGIKRVLHSNYNAVASISYQLNALGNRGPRQMQCEINTTSANSSSTPLLFKLKDVKLVLKDKWSKRQSKLWRWCLNFIGWVTFGSISEFELVSCLDNEAGLKEHENIILGFEKIPVGVFTMDYQYPLSAFQAFAICLSTFETKIACE